MLTDTSGYTTPSVSLRVPRASKTRHQEISVAISDGILNQSPGISSKVGSKQRRDENPLVSSPNSTNSKGATAAAGFGPRAPPGSLSEAPHSDSAGGGGPSQQRVAADGKGSVDVSVPCIPVSRPAMISVERICDGTSPGVAPQVLLSHAGEPPPQRSPTEAGGPLTPVPAEKVLSTNRRHFFTQMFAVVQRELRGHWRCKVATMMELVAPMLFILIIIILDLSFGFSDIAEFNFINYNGITHNLEPALHRYLFCSGNANAPIPSLDSCDVVTWASTCDGDESGIPVTGLCRSATLTTPLQPVKFFVEAMTGRMATLPTLDYLISMQWMAKKAGLATDTRIVNVLSAFSRAGIAVGSASRYDSITYSGRLYFAPSENVPRSLIEYIYNTSELFQFVYGGTFTTVAEAERWIARSNSSRASPLSTWGLIVIHDLQTGFDVDIRLNKDALPPMHTTVDARYRAGYSFDSSDMYLCSGFTTLQKMLLDYFINQTTSRTGVALPYTPETLDPLVASMPTVRAKRPQLLTFASSVIAFISVLSFLYPFSQMTKRVVLEKELRIREAMFIMGLRKSSLLFALALISLFECVLISITVTVLLRVTVVRRSSSMALFIVVLLFALTLIPLSGLIAALFNKARLAAFMAPLLFFVMSCPIFAVSSASNAVILGFSIMSPTCFASILQHLLNLETGGGFSFEHLRGDPHLPALSYLNLMMLAVDIVVYTLLQLYLDEVLPRDWGAPSHPLFFIRVPYTYLRAGCCRRTDTHTIGSDDNNPSASSDTDSQVQKPILDPNVGIDALGNRKPVSICIRRLCRSFRCRGGRCVAVEDFSLDLHRGDMSVLLGANGAGKSTLIHMLIGMLPPESGDCIIEGHSILSQLSSVRRNLGFCPQHNLLWPELTCRQHLEFVGKVKGLKGRHLEDTVYDLLRAVNLLDKEATPAKALSGGMKRRLSIAIAFVGENNIVVLDEPTAGVDVTGRRHIWSFLKQMASNCTILLTTHNMEEAELLGDKIAFVQSGRLCCAGSSLFLRRHLGKGYTIRFDMPLTLHEVSPQHHLPVTLTRLGELVRTHIPDATPVHASATEISYGIPMARERQLPSLLQALEREGNTALGIRGYALLGPSLEDVFVNIVESSTEEGNKKRKLSDVQGGRGDPFTYTSPTSKNAPSKSGGALRTLLPPTQAGICLPFSTDDNHSGSPDVEAVQAHPSASPPHSLGEETAPTSQESLLRRMDEDVQHAWEVESVTAGARLARMQLEAILYKRFKYALRDYRMIFFQIVCPVVCIFLAISLQYITFNPGTELLITPNMFTRPTEVMVSGCEPLFGPSQVQPINAPVDGWNQVSQPDGNFMSAYDMSNYLTDSWYLHGSLDRYAAIQCHDPITDEFVESMYWVTTKKADSLLFLYNTSSYHSLPFALHTFLAMMYNNVRQQAAGQLPNNGTHTEALRWPPRLTASTLPLSKDSRESMDAMVTIIFGVIVLIPFTFLPSNPMVWIVKERETSARHLQRICGVHFQWYWVANFLFDFFSYLVTAVLVLIVFCAFRRQEYVGGDTIGCTVVSLLLYGLCVCCGTYAFSFLFREHTTAQLVTVGVCFISGFLFVLLVLILSLLEKTKSASLTLRWIFRLVPTYSIGEVILNLALLKQKRLVDPSTSPWSLEMSGYALLYMGAEVPIFVAFTLLWDHPSRRAIVQRCVSFFFCCRGHASSESLKTKKDRSSSATDRSSTAPDDGPSHQHRSSDTWGDYKTQDDMSEAEDSDVEAERLAVYRDQASGKAGDVVRVVNLRKVYSGHVVAVKRMSFAVMPGEVFAFLGPNGAGKSTTLSILCLEQQPTSGEAYLCGRSVTTDGAAALRGIGYCPQFDATFDLLTVEEHLTVYAGIRGVPARARPSLVMCLIRLCDLVPFQHVFSKHLSGGNRRKLSVAISLIGAPRVVFLDEPTAGMDPVARRSVWNVIECVKKRCSIVLTTHYLKEVEALASCVGIMVDGRMRCLGDLPHLKHKYGSDHYELCIRVRKETVQTRPVEKASLLPQPASSGGNEPESAVPVVTFMSQHLPCARLMDCMHFERYVYAIPISQGILKDRPHSIVNDEGKTENASDNALLNTLDCTTSCPLSHVFELLQAHQVRLGIVDYNLSQMTIEQVFLRVCEDEGMSGTAQETEETTQLSLRDGQFPFAQKTHLHAVSGIQAHVFTTPSETGTNRSLNATDYARFRRQQ